MHDFKSTFSFDWKTKNKQGRFIIPYEGMTNEDASQLTGQTVKIDGEEVKILGVEYFACYPPKYITNGIISVMIDKECGPETGSTGHG